MAAAAGLGLQREAAEGKWPAWRMTEETRIAYWIKDRQLTNHDSAILELQKVLKTCCAQSMKIFCCLWNFVYKQLEEDAAQGLTMGGDVEEHEGRAACPGCLLPHPPSSWNNIAVKKLRPYC
ncbi:ARMCX4 isoform 10 [Pongo abelii]|uniref:ARMCX4 isoform 10 n=1 Tax=Pongo abelii TaxID=9601 RepID=A0A2J8U620_PONAB|nr:ARMCX4 isoform 10 [Pongo abelii]